MATASSTNSLDGGSGWGTSPLAGYQFTYDAASRIDSIDSYVDGLTSFTHDDTNQLQTADHTGQTDESYSYDENGNRTMSGYSIGTNNRLTSDGTYNYTYDDEGNRLTKTTIATGEKEEYTWDWRNRLTKITFKDSGGTVTKTVDQTYDAFNQWIRRSVDADGPGSGAAVDTFFSHEGGQVALQFGGSASSNLSHRYLWNPAAIDQLLADESVTSLATAGDVQYPLGDHLGTLRDLASYNTGTNTTTIDNHRRYDSYGNLISETNAAVDQLFGYTARALDGSTGLQNNLNRWCDAKTGQWLSEDPTGLGPDVNPYRYVGNAPTLHTDPSGLDWKGRGTGQMPGMPPGFTWEDWYAYQEFFLPWRMPAKSDGLDYCLAGGKFVGWGMAIVGASGAAIAEATGVGGIVIIGGTGAAGAGGLGVGTTAVTPIGLPAGTYAAIMVNGAVYVARFHEKAWELAGRCGEIQRYGFVTIDKTGKVVEWAGEFSK